MKKLIIAFLVFLFISCNKKITVQDASNGKGKCGKFLR